MRDTIQLANNSTDDRNKFLWQYCNKSTNVNEYGITFPMVWVCGSPVLAVLIFLLVPLGISWNHSIVETIHFDMSICKIIQLWSCYQLVIFKGGLYVTLIFSLSSLVCGSKIEEHENMCQLQYISRSNVNYWNWFSNIQHYFSYKSNIQILVLIPVKNSNIGRRLQMGESQSFFSLHSFFFSSSSSWL